MGKIRKALRVATYTLALPLISEVSGCTQSAVDSEIRGTEKICREAYGSYYDNYESIQKTSGRIGLGAGLGLIGLTFGLIGIDERRERK